HAAPAGQADRVAPARAARRGAARHAGRRREATGPGDPRPDQRRGSPVKLGVRLAALLVAAAGASAGPGRALAYDPATTHAGLTQRAIVASTLHTALARRF